MAFALGGLLLYDVDFLSMLEHCACVKRIMLYRDAGFEQDFGKTVLILFSVIFFKHTVKKIFFHDPCTVHNTASAASEPVCYAVCSSED